VVKNKLAPPFKQSIHSMYGGASPRWRNPRLGVKAGIVEKSGGGSPMIATAGSRPRELKGLPQGNPTWAKIETAIRQNSGLMPSRFWQAPRGDADGEDGEE